MDYIPRSLLFNIEPIGIGTPYVESLSSYISRLANVHCLTTGVFISKLLSRYLNKYYLTKIADRGGNGFYDSSNGVNGIGSLAKDFINVIESLTYRTNLYKNTLLPWANILPTRGLMESKKKWCPQCYEEALINKNPIYDPLIWYLKDSNVCLKHKSVLISTCMTCNKKMNILSRNSILGYCENCHSWLGSKDRIENSESNNIKEIIGFETKIGEMLEISSRRKNIFIHKNQIAKSLNFYLNNLFEGSLSTFAQISDVPKTTFHYWVKGINLPALHNLLTISYKLDIGIIDFLEMKYVERIESGDLVLPLIQSKERKKYDYEQIKIILLHELNNSECNSLSKIAKIIGCDRKLLYTKFPSETNLIVENHKNHLKLQKIKRQETSDKELLDAITNLCKRNIYPSRRNVEKELMGKYLLKENHIRNTWNELKKNL